MFRVTRLTDPSLIRAFLTANGAGERARYAYMIGDLNVPYWDQSRFYGAFDGQDTLQSVLLYYEGVIERPPVITAGDANGINACWSALLADFDLRTVVYHAQSAHLAVVQRYFTAADPMAMWRMAITPDQLNTKSIGKIDSARRLTGSDARVAQSLFDSGSAADFMDGRPHVSSDLLAGVPFYGAFAAGQPVAIAGTHILSVPERLGAVGYVFTHPAARGQGYAAAVTAAITRSLFEAGLDLVVLNVKQNNTPAIRAYERVGYVHQSPLYEGVAYRLVVDKPA